MKNLLTPFAIAYSEIMKLEDITDFETLIAEDNLIVASFKVPDSTLVCGTNLHYETTHWLNDNELYAEYRLILKTL